MNNGRSSFAVVGHEGMIYVIGGFLSGQVLYFELDIYELM
jgi:hypothetical protein